jgi:flagellar basal-body rod protein FlgF
MDRLIYTAAASAKMLTQRQETIAHNLANISTNGFRAELTAFRAVDVVGTGSDTRVASVETTVGADFTPGQMMNTGNPLDVAINGRGFFVVQAPDGSEAFTRDGGFSISPDGTLQTRQGLSVLGDGGPLQIPPNYNVLFGRDGTISAVPLTDAKNAVITIGRLKLVNPDEAQVERGADGLFRMKGGQTAESDPAMTIAQGTIEGSNVNAVDMLVSMIAAGRQFDQQMKLLRDADTNAQRANQLLSLT